MMFHRCQRQSYPNRAVCADQILVIVGVAETVSIGRLKPLPQSERRDPSEAIVEFSLVVLKLPNVKSGRYLKSPITCSAAAENPSDAGSNACAGSRLSPKRDQQVPTSSTRHGKSAVVSLP